MKKLFFLSSLVIIIGLGLSGCQDKSPPGNLIQDGMVMKVEQPSFQYAVMQTETQVVTPVMRESLPLYTLTSMEGGEGEVQSEGSWILRNWLELLLGLLAFIEIVVRLTPTKRDDSIIDWIHKLLSAIIPNKIKGGGLFKIQRE
jgi:hypothetical protein